MRYLQYAGPSDAFDASALLDKPETVFFSPHSLSIPHYLRGNVIGLQDEDAEQLLTYPNHYFATVEEDVALPAVAKQKEVREAYDAQVRAQKAEAIKAATGHDVEYVDPTVSTSPAFPVAEGAPRSSADIKASVKRAEGAEDAEDAEAEAPAERTAKKPAARPQRDDADDEHMTPDPEPTTPLEG